MEKWQEGSLNEVSIEGILSEVNLKETTDKNGNPAICGEYKIRTTNVIDGVSHQVEIPVRVYQSKITNNKKENPAYATAQKIMKDYVSIAAGGEDKADAIRLPERSTSLQENFFVSKTTGQMIYGAGIRASFANQINKADMDSGAKFKAIVVVGDLIDELDKNDNETGRLILKGVIPTWGGKVDVIDFVASNRKVIDHIRNSWHKGDTVMIGGVINFSSVVKETVSDEGDSFGEPIVNKKTQTVREFVITGGHESPLTEEEGAYSSDAIAEALQERQKRIEVKKNNASTSAPKKAPSFGF